MLIDGSLATWLREQHGVLSPQQVAYIMHKAADALQQVHNQGSIHQDINLSSFLIHANGGGPEHFDLQLASLGTGTQTFTRFGRIYPANSQLMYMAPEQWNGQATPATDQYALAVMAYELLTGRPPFSGPPAQLMDSHMRVQPAAPSTLNQRISPTIDAVILTALAKRPEDRFPSVSAFAYALEQALRHPEPQPQIVSVGGANVDGSLRATLLINSTEAATGTLRTITLPQGRRITIAVPGGVYDGQIIRLEGFGNSSPMGGSVGPVLLTIAVSPTEQNISTVAPTQQTQAAPTFASSTLNSSRVMANRAYTTVTNLPPGRRAALLVTIVLILILGSIGLFSLIQTSAGVAIPYPPHSGSLALNDLLHDNNGGNGWPEGTSSNGSACQFAQEAYHVSVTQAGGFYYCIAGTTAFSNFAYEVRMTLIKGDQGGIIFRADGAKSKFYYFGIGRDGSYSLYLHVDATGSHARLLASGMNAAIHTGLNVPNLLAVVARSGTLDLYVNNQHITSVNDSTYGDGQVGVVAANVTDPTEIAFSDARLWTL